MIMITVTAGDLAETRTDGSTITLVGTDEKGRRTYFAGDWRPMDAFIQAVEEEGEATAAVEPWQILGGAL